MMFVYGAFSLIFNATSLKFLNMKEITLFFDISGKRLDYEETGTLRGEISDRLDKELKEASVGRWAGGTCNLVSMEIFLKVSDTEKAVEIINSALTDHWLFPLMEIRYQKEIR